MDNKRDWLDYLLSKDGRRAVEVFTRHIMATNRAVTRGSATNSTVGCRWWQLVYAILVSLPYPPSTILTWSKGINSPDEWRIYQEMVGVVRAVVKQIETYKRSSLFKILYNNLAIECAPNADSPCIRRIDPSFFSTSPDGRYYMCIYGDEFIGHYFVLQQRDGIWYLSSSYGSGFVRVPVQTKEVTEDELYHFVDAIQKNENGNGTGTPVIEQFYGKYFLEGGLSTRYSENEPRRRGKQIPAETGISEELKVALSGTLHIGYIESMEEYIQQLVKDTVGSEAEGGAKKRVSKRRTLRRKIGARLRKRTQRRRRLNRI